MIRSFTLILLGQLQVLMLIAGLNWSGYSTNISFNAILAGIFVGLSLALGASIISSIRDDLSAIKQVLSYNLEESNNV